MPLIEPLEHPQEQKVQNDAPNDCDERVSRGEKRIPSAFHFRVAARYEITE